jgi:hypothetical protein
MSTTLATVHRASPVCHSQSLEFSANPGFVLNTGCYDLMYSGHSAFCVVCAFFVCCHPSVGVALQAVVSVVAAAGCIANVLVGDHFTADCLIGAYISLLLCILYRTRFKASFKRPRTVRGVTQLGQKLGREEVKGGSGSGEMMEDVGGDGEEDGSAMEVDEGEGVEELQLQSLLTRVRKWKLQEGEEG